MSTVYENGNFENWPPEEFVKLKISLRDPETLDKLTPKFIDGLLNACTECEEALPCLVNAIAKGDDVRFMVLAHDPFLDWFQPSKSAVTQIVVANMCATDNKTVWDGLWKTRWLYQMNEQLLLCLSECPTVEVIPLDLILKTLGSENFPFEEDAVSTLVNFVGQRDNVAKAFQEDSQIMRIFDLFIREPEMLKPLLLASIPDIWEPSAAVIEKLGLSVQCNPENASNQNQELRKLNNPHNLSATDSSIESIIFHATIYELLGRLQGRDRRSINLILVRFPQLPFHCLDFLKANYEQIATQCSAEYFLVLIARTSSDFAKKLLEQNAFEYVKNLINFQADVAVVTRSVALLKALLNEMSKSQAQESIALVIDRAIQQDVKAMTWNQLITYDANREAVEYFTMSRYVEEFVKKETDCQPIVTYLINVLRQLDSNSMESGWFVRITSALGMYMEAGHFATDGELMKLKALIEVELPDSNANDALKRNLAYIGAKIIQAKPHLNEEFKDSVLRVKPQLATQ